MSLHGNESRLDVLSLIKSPRGDAGSQLSKDRSVDTFASKPKSLPRLDKRLESYHTNAKYKVGYNEEVFERFCKIKEEVFNLNRELYVNVRTNECEKLILYLGEGPTFVKVAADKALYIGGISVQPTKNVLVFEAYGL